LTVYPLPSRHAARAFCLVLLDGGLLLLLRRRGVLAPTLAARGYRAYRCTVASVTPDDFGHDRAARCPPRAGTRRRAGSRRRRRSRSRSLGRICRVVLALVDGPRVACPFVLLLLVGRLALRGINVLRRGARGEQRRGDQRATLACTVRDLHCSLRE